MIQFSEETKAKIAELCRKNKVRELSLFGSRARGDARPDSDYDLLVEFFPDAGIGLIKYSRMQIDLTNILASKVDLVTKKGLKEYLRDNVLAEATPIYEA
jgi:predicted nucleotidyltransferase